MKPTSFKTLIEIVNNQRYIGGLTKCFKLYIVEGVYSD